MHTFLYILYRYLLFTCRIVFVLSYKKVGKKALKFFWFHHRQKEIKLQRLRFMIWNLCRNNSPKLFSNQENIFALLPTIFSSSQNYDIFGRIIAKYCTWTKLQGIYCTAESKATKLLLSKKAIIKGLRSKATHSYKRRTPHHTK